MQASSLTRFVRQLRQELAGAEPAGGSPAPGLRRATLDLRFTAAPDPSGGYCFQPVVGGAAAGLEPAALHGLKLEFEEGVRVPATAARPALSSMGAEAEAPAGGDATTLRRRLEFLLGGVPGFTTGAKAGILAELLAEFGRPALLEALQRDWIREFDTGADASPSVLQVPPNRAEP